MPLAATGMFMGMLGRLTVLALLCELAPATAAQDQVTILGGDPAATLPDATVTMTGGLISAGIGYGWGHGTLSYQGNQYTFCIQGLSVGEVGAADLKAQGAVFHMSSLEDFAGKYSAISIGAALLRGESSAMLKNQRGVTIQLETRVIGLRFNIAASGINIRLAGKRGCPDPRAAKK